MDDFTLDTSGIPAEWLTDVDGATYPFVEDEDHNLTGYGWLPLDAFVSAVNRYDEALGHVADEPVTSLDLAWLWVKHGEDGESLVVLDPESVEDEPDAMQVTAVWGKR